MSMNEYNIRIIILDVLVIVSLISLIFILIKDGKTQGWFKNHFTWYKIIVSLIGSFCACLFVINLFSAVSFKEEICDNMRVEEIVYISSLGDILPHYTLYLTDQNGKALTCSTIIFSSKALNKKMECISEGDVIKIKYKSGVNYVYDVE